MPAFSHSWLPSAPWYLFLSLIFCHSSWFPGVRFLFTCKQVSFDVMGSGLLPSAFSHSLPPVLYLCCSFGFCRWDLACCLPCLPATCTALLPSFCFRAVIFVLLSVCITVPPFSGGLIHSTACLWISHSRFDFLSVFGFSSGYPLPWDILRLPSHSIFFCPVLRVFLHLFLGTR